MNPKSYHRNIYGLWNRQPLWLYPNLDWTFHFKAKCVLGILGYSYWWFFAIINDTKTQFTYMLVAFGVQFLWRHGSGWLGRIMAFSIRFILVRIIKTGTDTLQWKSGMTYSVVFADSEMYKVQIAPFWYETRKTRHCSRHTRAESTDSDKCFLLANEINVGIWRTPKKSRDGANFSVTMFHKKAMNTYAAILKR